MKPWFGRFAIGLAGLASMIAAASARITHIEIIKSEPAFGGQSFGDIGAYERLTGQLTGELDPADPANSGIQDINLAPRNERGMVEYVTNIELLKPADMARGNRILFFEVNNRGNKLAPASFNTGVAGGVAERNALSSSGDGWLMRAGYTMVWFGWEMDVRPGMGRIGMPPIVARNHDGSAITGTVRSEIITPLPTTSVPISLSQQIQNYPVDSYDSYPTANLDNSAPFADGFLPTLTVRAREQDPREPIPNSAWSFGTCDQGATASPDEKHLCYRDGFKPGRLYELIYRAKDPTVGGLGFAAARDLGAFLRNSEQDDAGAVNPVYRPDNLAIIEGSSQSGRMIRSLLALGFNRDETGRRVFDGAFPHIGGGLMPLNVRFGQPVRAWGEQTDHLYPAYDFPFTYARQTDPLTQRTEGLFDRCDASDTCPKLFHVATALEMWEARQSLGLTDPLGRTDVADPANVRTYIMASTQHGAAPLPLAAHAPFGNCQQQPNPNPQVWTMRALMTAFAAWVRDGIEPPPSAKPSIADGTLVPPDRVRFPEIPANFYGEVDRPAVSPLRIYDTLHVLDFGPLYRPEDSSGVITREPPQVGSGSYGILEMQVDADGNDLAGIRSVFLQTPIGTYTGWNLGRKDRFENGMCNLQGSFIPFAATKAERIATGDPRLSLEERYPSKDVYLAAFKKAADDLVAKRFLLPDDADALVKSAESEGVRNAP
ncbi:MAG TPA: alpha/beta hydrolase domain-containing protein [Roseiarcus sp.]